MYEHRCTNTKSKAKDIHKWGNYYICLYIERAFFAFLSEDDQAIMNIRRK